MGCLDPHPALGDQVRGGIPDQRQAGRLGEKPRREGPGGLPEGGVWGGARLQGQKEEEVLWSDELPKWREFV